MYDIRGIISRNNKTFYDFSSGQRKAIWPRVTIQIAVSAILSIVSADGIGEFLNGILATQAILTGFSFTLLFYLMSAEASEIRFNKSSLEHKVRADRIRKLSRELFDNISYYSLISLMSIIAATALLAPSPKEKMGEAVQYVVGLLPEKVSAYADFAAPYVSMTIFVIFCVLVTLLYFLIIESFYNFFRNIDRANFLFKERIALAKPDQD